MMQMTAVKGMKAMPLRRFDVGAHLKKKCQNCKKASAALSEAYHKKMQAGFQSFLELIHVV